MCTATGFMVVYGLGGALDTIAAQVGELRARVPVAAPSRDEDAWVWWFTTRRRARRASRHARVRSAGRCDASFHHAPLPSHSQPDGLDHPVRCHPFMNSKWDRDPSHLTLPANPSLTGVRRATNVFISKLNLHSD